MISTTTARTLSRSLCRTLVRTRHTAAILRNSTFQIRAIDNREGGDNLDEMFKKELERRQINSVDDLRNATPQKRIVTPPPTFAAENRGDLDEVPPQLQKSRELNSEGLEGLIPRASQLLQLGLSFFLAFGPFIVGVAIAFALIYSVFGENFVHTGKPTGPVPYIDPQELLNEPTVDPMIPL